MTSRYNPKIPEHKKIYGKIANNLPKSFKTTKQILDESGVCSIQNTTEYSIGNAVLRHMVGEKVLVRKIHGAGNTFCMKACTEYPGDPILNKTRKKDVEVEKSEIELLRKEIEELKETVAKQRMIQFISRPRPLLPEITHEDLTEIRRKEENSMFLSRIPDGFYGMMQKCIDDNEEKKKKILVENPEIYDGISSRAKKMQTLIERIIYIRTTKVITLAHRYAFEGLKILPENMTENEKELYNQSFKSLCDMQIKPQNKEVI